MKNLKTIEILKESLTTSVTTSLTSSVITEYSRILPDNGWLVLCQFAMNKINNGNNRAMSATDLDLIFKGQIHMNTIRSMIKRLLHRSFIKLWREDWGKTRSQKTYVVTTDGLLIYDKYKKEVIDML